MLASGQIVGLQTSVYWLPYFPPDMRTYPITDDHYPLLKAGLRVIDVIDIDYGPPAPNGYHHTLQDTIDKISAQSLQVVGDVALALLTDF